MKHNYNLITALLLLCTQLMHAQNVGINTASPAASLHVVKSGFSGGTVHSLAVAVFENSSNSYLQLLSPTSQSSAIISGNQVTNIRSAIFFSPDSSVSIRTGGNASRLFVNKSGRVGINTINPLALLHVRSSILNGPVHPETVALLENNGSSVLQFMNSTGGRAGIVSGTAISTVRSSIYFNHDQSIQFNTGGDVQRMKITASGNVGIGTTTDPVTKFQVDGNFQLGISGGPLHGINRFSVMVNVPSIPANSSLTHQVTYPGVLTSAVVGVAPPDLPHGLVIAYINTDPDKINIRFSNFSTSAINLPENVFHFSVIQ